MKRRARQHKAILLSGGFFIGGEVLTCFDMRRCHKTGDAFALDQPVQQLPDRATGWINRGHGAAEPMSHTSYVYTAPAGVSLRRRTAQFACRLNASNVDEDIDCGVDRESDDI